MAVTKKTNLKKPKQAGEGVDTRDPPHTADWDVSRRNHYAGPLKM